MGDDREQVGRSSAYAGQVTQHLAGPTRWVEHRADRSSSTHDGGDSRLEASVAGRWRQVRDSPGWRPVQPDQREPGQQHQEGRGGDRADHQPHADQCDRHARGQRRTPSARASAASGTAVIAVPKIDGRGGQPRQRVVAGRCPPPAPHPAKRSPRSGTPNTCPVDSAVVRRWTPASSVTESYRRSPQGPMTFQLWVSPTSKPPP